MKIHGTPTRTINPRPAYCFEIIDQTALPHQLRWLNVQTLNEAAHAIRSMQVRGAPLIGATAAYGLAVALKTDTSDAHLEAAATLLRSTRPTAVNLHWALARMYQHLFPLAPEQRLDAAWAEAGKIAEEDVAQNQAIGQHGMSCLLPQSHSPERPLNVMTHCNAGWLATVDHGTALAPIYALHDAGIPIHVWVSETRPRNQGLLTAWELAQHGVPHTVFADNAAGWLLEEGKVDAIIVGADRIAANGDTANKVGTYLKALAANACNVPFFVAAPQSTLDFACPTGRNIPIEDRDGNECRQVLGLDAAGQPSSIQILPSGEAVVNPAFDVTPAALISRIITERGSCPADELRTLYPAI